MPSILIIEDEPELVKVLRDYLEKAGFSVETAYRGDTGLSLWEHKRPDLVILDVMFPESTHAGFDLARLIRHKSGKLKNVPILMLTAINAAFPLGFGPQDIDDAWMPVTGFLEKPIDFEVLKHEIARLLGETATAD